MELTEEQKQIIEKKIFGYKCNMCYNEGIQYNMNIFKITPIELSTDILMCTCKNCGHIMFWDFNFILKNEDNVLNF